MPVSEIRTHVTISLVLNGDWVVTLPDPNNHDTHTETELCRFNCENYAVGTYALSVQMRACAIAAHSIASMLGVDKAKITGHDPDLVKAMRPIAVQAGLTPIGAG